MLSKSSGLPFNWASIVWPHCHWPKLGNKNSLRRLSGLNYFSGLKRLRNSHRHFHKHLRFNVITADERPSSRSFSSSSSKRGLLSWYLTILETRPVITKSATSSAIYATADVTSQMMMSEDSFSWDFVRTLRLSVYGIVILGPSQHVWFNGVAKVLPTRDLVTTMKKIFLGQAIFGPINTSVFFSYNAALQAVCGPLLRRGFRQYYCQIKRDLLPTLRNSVVFWPICDFFTFKFVPVHLQPLVNSSFVYVWTIYLTYMASLKKAGRE